MCSGGAVFCDGVNTALESHKSLICSTDFDKILGRFVICCRANCVAHRHHCSHLLFLIHMRNSAFGGMSVSAWSFCVKKWGAGELIRWRGLVDGAGWWEWGHHSPAVLAINFGVVVLHQKAGSGRVDTDEAFG